MVDTPALGAGARKGVRVQVSPSALVLKEKILQSGGFFLFYSTHDADYW